ncbi:MAG: aminopeptidase N [Bdellovibrionales bacterium]|nr:aminopeptidase N [Bdellovibrionales bacterium]
MKNLIQYFLLLGLMTCMGFGCQSLYKSQFQEDSANLFYQDSKTRAELIENVHYTLKFEIGKQKQFQAETEIEFNLNENKKTLFLDFQQAQLHKISVNGNKLSPKKVYNGYKVFIEKDYLQKGSNKVNLSYSRDYVVDGNGLHQSKDPADGRVYLYTNLQPYHASRVFPGFDQPDLKASFTMQISAPKNWQVVTSVLEEKVESQKDKKIWHFPKSAIMSTYLWSLHAGPYAVIQGPKKPYPMRLFVRQSLKQYVKSSEWFPITTYGFKYFEDLFGVKYPFKKYDQIIVPEFNPGAMENIAAVTFNEAYLSRGKKTILQKYNLAEVILHELAHMWFGNLVTMKWWDDLWLNESFATFVSNLALSEHNTYKSYSWPQFYDMKLWAYSEDLMPTTHAIYTEVESTDVAFNQFDGITYGKGAAWLKQLYFRVGKQQFSKALELYFKRHQYGNTILEDFIQAFVEVNGEKNKQWSEVWLKTSGVNQLQFLCKDGNYKLEQKAVSGDQIKRDHIGVLKTDSGEYPWRSMKEKIVWENKAPKECSQWNYPNYNDLGYFLVNYNEQEVQKLKSHWNDFDNSFLRKMLINDLWHSTLYGSLNLRIYFDFILEVLKSEQDINVVSTVLSNYKMSSIEAMLKQISIEKFEMHFSQLEKILLNRLNKSKAGTDLQKLFFKSYVSYSLTESSNKQIKRWLSGKALPQGLNFDLDLKWSSLIELASQGVEHANLLESLKKQDSSLKAKNYQDMLGALNLDPKGKRALYKKLFEEQNPNLYSLRYKVVGLKDFIDYKDYDTKVAFDFLEQIKKADKTQKQEVLGRLVRLAPIGCDLSRAKKVKNFVDDHSLNKTLIKNLKKHAKYTELCAKVIKNYQ